MKIIKMNSRAATTIATFVLFVEFTTEVQLHVPTSNLITLFNNILDAVQTTFPGCSQLNHVYDSSSLLLNEAKANEIVVRMGTNSRELSTSVFVDLSNTANGEENSLQCFTQSNYHFKHHQPCSVVFFELQSALLDAAEHLNNATFGRRWPERILPLLPNNVHSAFFIFFTSHVPPDPPDFQAKVNILMDQTGMIRHSVFVIPESPHRINILTGLPKSTPLKVVLTHEFIDEISTGKYIFYKQYTDFHGSTITTTFCAVCPVDEKFYRERGMARTGFGVAWFIVQDKFNMTYNTESVFGVPQIGVVIDVDEEGNEVLSYDDFILPLVEGTAAMSSLVIPTPYIQDAILFTKPFIFDSMCFLTALPKLRNLKSMKVLREPLANEVWFGFMISFALMVGCMEVVYYFRERRQGWLVGLAAILRPILDQGSPFGSRMKCWGGRMFFGTWLFFLIVLGSAYKSKLISAIVIPHHDYPPRTFKELADSDYYIGAIFFQKIELDFASTNTSVNTELMRRAVEIDFLDPTCYQLMFEGNKACLGYMSVFEKIGLKYMVDVKGRLMFLKSKDTHFSVQGAMAISRFYPMLLEPFEFCLGALDAAGISNFLDESHIARNKKEGRIHAQRNIDTLKYYKGLTSDELTNDDKVVDIVMVLLKLGFSSASIVFVMEIVYLVVQTLLEICRESTPWRLKDFLPSGQGGIGPCIYERELCTRVEPNITLRQQIRQCKILELDLTPIYVA